MKLFPEPELESGETIRQSWLANHTQSQFRAVGGKLYLTDHRLVFEPHVVDAALAGKSCSLPLRDITDVGLEPGEFHVTHLFDGGLRTRLRVESLLGTPELFVVRNPEELQQIISEALPTAAGLKS